MKLTLRLMDIIMLLGVLLFTHTFAHFSGAVGYAKYRSDEMSRTHEVYQLFLKNMNERQQLERLLKTKIESKGTQ